MKKAFGICSSLLALTLVFVSLMGVSVHAQETEGTQDAQDGNKVVTSIFSSDGTLESAKTFEKNPKNFTPEGKVDDNSVGEIILTEGKSVKLGGKVYWSMGGKVTDKGNINTFVTNDLTGGLNRGTTIFSTSISGWFFDGKYHDCQNNPSEVAGLNKYLGESPTDNASTHEVNYDFTSGKGKPISYSFTGRESTNDKYIYLYYRYTCAGKDINGNITNNPRMGYLGYKIKVIPKPQPQQPKEYSAHLSYDPNGGNFDGRDTTFDDKDGAVHSDNDNTMVHVNITDKLPTRQGYKFVFWYDKDEYPKTKNAYNKDWAKTDTTRYNVPEGKQFATLDMQTSENGQTKTLTALWDKEYCLKYNADGGKATPADLTGTFGVNLGTLQPNTDPVTINVAAAVEKDGFVFKGWKDPTADKIYQPGDELKISSDNPDITLQAVWEKKSDNVQPGPGGDHHTPADPSISDISDDSHTPAAFPWLAPNYSSNTQAQLVAEQPTNDRMNLGKQQAVKQSRKPQAGKIDNTIPKTGETDSYSTMLSALGFSIVLISVWIKRRILEASK